MNIHESAMNASWAQSMFGMGFINLSGTCATTKIIQCYDMGIYSCEVSGKFEQDPDRVLDLQKQDFLARKRVVDAVDRWCTRKGAHKLIDGFLPILYDWEIAKASAKRLRDRGHLIFTDLTLTRFLLVMCFGAKSTTCGHESYEDDYATLTRTNAHRFMSLVKYLSYGQNEPNWIRATYTTYGQGLHPDFFNLEKTAFDASTPIFYITGDQFVPSILPHEMERIDNLIESSSWSVKPPPEYKDLVMGNKSDRPATTNWKFANIKTGTTCQNCGKAGEKMPSCSRCKLVRYCNKECQKAAWKMHRNVCKTAPPMNPLENLSRALDI